MQTDSSSHPEMTCQWCGGSIPEGESACSKCGAARPREDLVAPGFNQQEFEPGLNSRSADPDPASEELDEEARATQILKDMDAYIPDEPAPARRVTRDTSDDVFIVIGALAISGIAGGLMGWFVAPPLIHDLFQDVIGVDTDGPEAFRRLGAFIGGMIAMLFGALLVTMMRR
jgi:hypothetical protein